MEEYKIVRVQTTVSVSWVPLQVASLTSLPAPSREKLIKLALKHWYDITYCASLSNALTLVSWNWRCVVIISQLLHLLFFIYDRPAETDINPTRLSQPKAGEAEIESDFTLSRLSQPKAGEAEFVKTTKKIAIGDHFKLILTWDGSC